MQEKSLDVYTAINPHKQAEQLTLSETIAAIKMANAAKMTCVISHRSGETEDTTIAHFVVGLGCGQIKTGSLCRTDRVAKYNELLRIEEQLGKKAVFAGKNAFKA